MAAMLLNKRNRKGWDVRKLLHFVLYEGGVEHMPERIFLAGRHPDYKIEHYGLNSIGEVSGWVLTETTPPRNGRTSKNLIALGYPVRDY